MTPAEYKELIKKDTIKIGQDVEMTDSVTELFNELVDDGHDADDLQAFIDEHGKSYFESYIEDYLQAIDEYDDEVVEDFIEIFGVCSISSLSDAYQGKWNSGAEFAQNLAEDCGEVPTNMSSWIEIDWKASWDNLSYDYTEGANGHFFNTNF